MKYLDLTNSDYKSNSKWNTVGLKQEQIPLPKAQKIANVIAVINIPFPTCSVVTSPIIIKIGQRMSMKERIKLKWENLNKS